MGKEATCISIVVFGHAGSGKTTTTGHLIHQLSGIDEHVIKKLKKEPAEMNKGSSKYAWVLDKAKAGSVNTTLNFETSKYHCTVSDAPGCRDMRKMAAMLSQADCAILVVDSSSVKIFSKMENFEQTHDQLILAFAMGVAQVICCFNKMDVTTPSYSKSQYDEMFWNVSFLLEKVGYDCNKVPFIPISSFEGDNMVERSTNLDWYKGPTLLEAIDTVLQPKCPSDKQQGHLRLQELLNDLDRCAIDNKTGSDHEIKPQNTAAECDFLDTRLLPPIP